MPAWIENVSAFTEAFGAEKATLILPLASIPWASEERRDTFIDLMMGGGSGG